MNKRIKLTIGIGLTVLLLAAVFATAAFAQGPGPARLSAGMMGGQGFGGMMGGQAARFGGEQGAGEGCPMFGGAANPTNAQPITFDKAVESCRAVPEELQQRDLALAEVMEFDNNFYAVVTEKSTGVGAFELLVNRYTGFVHPEPGPNMMWNTKYGHMAGFGGMMGAWAA